MSKVEKKQDGTELVATMANPLTMVGEDIHQGMIDAQTGTFFPFMEMVFPVMLQNPESPYEPEHNYKFGFRNGGKFEVFPADTIFTVIDMRNSIKRKYIDDTGSNRNEYAYSKITRNQVEYGQSDTRFQELLSQAQDRSNSDVMLGASLVVVAILPDGRAVAVDFAAYKTVYGYMYPPLKPRLAVKGLGLKVTIEDHKKNLTKSKAGNYYPDGKKFSDWETVQLTKPQLTQIRDTLKEASEQYENWLKK